MASVRARTAGFAYSSSPGPSQGDPWPVLRTPGEVATLLRTSRKAIYAMVERGQLPGTVRIGRRVLFRESDLVEWLRQKTVPSLERNQ
jgi:excisionase family DNA binding protein